MKGFVAIVLTMAFLVAPGLALGEQGVHFEAPPAIEQRLVPEGYFATKLAASLNLGNAGTDAEAESLLTAAGIAPRNGWIAGYPVTPDILAELRDAIETAADTGALAMSRDEALNALQAVVEAELGLTIDSEPPDGYADGEGPGYVEPPEIIDYYYSEGPPVVTYYPPPPDYSYLYGWVPSPFWCNGFYFPGFFVLSDFDVIVVEHAHPHRGYGHRHRDAFEVTNHFADPRTNRVTVVNPARRGTGHDSAASRREGAVKGFATDRAATSARSIHERHRGGPPRFVTPGRHGPEMDGSTPDRARQWAPFRGAAGRPDGSPTLGGVGRVPGHVDVPKQRIQRFQAPLPSGGENRGGSFGRGFYRSPEGRSYNSHPITSHGFAPAQRSQGMAPSFRVEGMPGSPAFDRSGFSGRFERSCRGRC